MFFRFLYQYLDRYLQRFNDELEQIDLKNQIGQRQKTPQYASRKALIESTINAERHEYETTGFSMRTLFAFFSMNVSFSFTEIPNLSRTDSVKELRYESFFFIK